MSFIAFLASEGGTAKFNDRVSALRKFHESSGEQELGDCVKTTSALDSAGSGAAYDELPRHMRLGLPPTAPKISHATTGDSICCVTSSKLKRTMADVNLLQAMGLGMDTDAEAPPPPDGKLILGHFGKVMAKQKWKKANTALTALRSMKLGGMMGLGKPAPPPADSSPGWVDEGADSGGKPFAASKRMSITELKPRTSEAGDSATQTTAVAGHVMGKLPKIEELAEMCTALSGPFVFAIIEASHGFAVAARSAEESPALFYVFDLDGTLAFSNDAVALATLNPDDPPMELLPGHVLCARAGMTSAKSAPFTGEGSVARVSQQEFRGFRRKSFTGSDDGTPLTGVERRTSQNGV